MEETRQSAKRVLIVEDHEDAAEALRLVLEREGHVVDVAGAGFEGIGEARRFAPDVVICDLGLPDVDGLGVARVFRSDPQLRDVWLIALSAYYVPSAASAAGFDEYVSKPADLERLAQHLREEPPRHDPAGA